MVENAVGLEHRLGQLDAGQQLLQQNMESGFTSMGRRLDALTERVGMQNGRVAIAETAIRLLEDAAQRQAGAIEGRRALRASEYAVLSFLVTLGGILAGMVVKVLT